MEAVSLDFMTMICDIKNSSPLENRVEVQYKVIEMFHLHVKPLYQQDYTNILLIIQETRALYGLLQQQYFETYRGSGEFSKKEKSGVLCLEFPGVKPVLYNLPAIVRAVESKDTVYIVEGEKDADNLIKLNLTATTTFDGASKSNFKYHKNDNGRLLRYIKSIQPDGQTV